MVFSMSRGMGTIDKQQIRITLRKKVSQEADPF